MVGIAKNKCARDCWGLWEQSRPSLQNKFLNGIACDEPVGRRDFDPDTLVLMVALLPASVGRAPIRWKVCEAGCHVIRTHFCGKQESRILGLCGRVRCEAVPRSNTQYPGPTPKMAATGDQLVDLFFEHRGKTIDKWEHYLSIYAREFAPFFALRRPIRLLEIGVQNGGSLELWAKSPGRFGDYRPRC